MAGSVTHKQVFDDAVVEADAAIMAAQRTLAEINARMAALRIAKGSPPAWTKAVNGLAQMEEDLERMSVGLSTHRMSLNSGFR